MKILGTVLLMSALSASLAFAAESGEKRETAAVNEYNQKYIDEVNSERQLENARKEERAKFHQKMQDKFKH